MRRKFSEGLYPKERRKPYFAKLSALQDTLGALNDAVVAQRLVDEASHGLGLAAARAGGYIYGVRKANADTAAAAALPAWRELVETPPFWRSEIPLTPPADMPTIEEV